MREQTRLCFLNRIPIFVSLALCVYGTNLLAGPDGPDRSRGPKAVVDDPKPLSFRVSYSYRDGGNGKPKRIENDTILRSGDHYKIQFTPNEDSYVYIFQIDSSDTIYQLFPMEKWKNLTLKNRNPVRAGVGYVLPADNKSFVLDDQRGSEIIYFIATRDEDPNIRELAERLRDARRRGDPVRDKRLQQALTGEIQKRGVLVETIPDPDSRVEISWENQEGFSLPGQRLDNLCAQCSNAVAFKHQ
jgi:Domain of unknown function (DUF4384)